MASSGGGRERRRWPRSPLSGDVVGRIYTEQAAPFLDLSEGGALVEVPCALRPGSIYSLRVAIGPATVLMLKASVVRSYVQRLESAGKGETVARYQVALQFVDLRPADRELLRRRIAGEAISGPGLTQAAHETEGVPPVERRDSMRVDLERAVAGEVGLTLESRVLMLSPGGMTLRMPFRPELGSEMTCTLDVGGVPAQVKGVVRDAYQATPENERLDFIVGLEFIDVRSETRMLIETYLARKG